MKEMKIDDVKVEKEKKAKEPAPHVKAAQIDEKTPSNVPEAFTSIDDDDIPW